MPNPKIYCLDARTATDHFPGIGRYVSSLSRAIVPLLTPDEHLLLLHNPQPTRWQLPAPTTNVTHIATAVSPFSLAQQIHIPRLLRRHHAHLYHSPYFLMPYAALPPTLVTLYDLIPKRYPAYATPSARIISHIATQLAIRSADRLIAISEATRQDFLAAYHLPPAKITAVPLGVDPQFQPQSPATIATIQQKYALPSRYVLYLGINKPHKNLPCLLHAWSHLHQTAANLPQLIIAGAWDPRYPQAKQLAHDLHLAEQITFLGPVADADLPALYSGAELFVFPSLYEGFGLPVLEAMACGTAVLCTHTSSLPEVGGDAATYFPPNDSAALATQLHTLLHNPATRTAHAQAGQQRAQQFTWQATAQATLTLYRQF